MASIPVKIILDVDGDNPIEAKIKGQALSGSEGEGVIGYAADDLNWINSSGQIMSVGQKLLASNSVVQSLFLGSGSFIGNTDGLNGTAALTYAHTAPLDGFYVYELEYTFTFAATGTMKFKPFLNGSAIFHGYPEKYFNGISGQTQTINMTFYSQGVILAGAIFSVELTTSVDDLIFGTHQHYNKVTRYSSMSFVTSSSGGGGEL